MGIKVLDCFETSLDPCGLTTARYKRRRTDTIIATNEVGPPNLVPPTYVRTSARV